jgi:hypothetical protein
MREGYLPGARDQEGVVDDAVAGVRRRAVAVPSGHDAKSAALLGWLHVQGWSRRWAEVSEEMRELRAQLRVLELSQKAERRLLNQLEGLLARHWPELLELMSLDTASVQEMLSQFGGPGGVRRHPQACRQLMRGGGEPRRWWRARWAPAMGGGGASDGRRSVGSSSASSSSRSCRVWRRPWAR